MEQYETLWAFQTEDMKADAIASAIKRSPTRQKLEKARDFILDRQKQYKQIEEDVAAMVDRKEIIAQAVTRAEEQMKTLLARYEANPPQSAEDVKALLSEVSRCRDTIRQYEAEISRIVKETESNDKLQRSVRVEAANAKKSFDQLKTFRGPFQNQGRNTGGVRNLRAYDYPLIHRLVFRYKTPALITRRGFCI